MKTSKASRTARWRLRERPIITGIIFQGAGIIMAWYFRSAMGAWSVGDGRRGTFRTSHGRKLRGPTKLTICEGCKTMSQDHKHPRNARATILRRWSRSDLWPPASEFVLL